MRQLSDRKEDAAPSPTKKKINDSQSAADLASARSGRTVASGQPKGSV